VELNPRREDILKHIVEDYVVTAQPVGSEAVARRHRPPISSATVRNEMAVLEGMGYIAQPHTSAGRMPTDSGYRYYVERLMPGIGPSAGEERRIRHQFHQVEFEVGQWAHLASSVLADTVHAAAVVTLPVSPKARVRRLELLSLHDRVVLVALILQSGSVRQHVQHLSEPLDRDELARVNTGLNEALEGKTARQTARHSERLSGPDASFCEAVARMLQQADRQTFEQIYYEGLSHVLSQPEFAQSEKLRPVVDVLEHSQVLGAFLADAMEGQDVQIIIGSEHRLEPLRSTATVLTRYGAGDEVRGVLGVVGPTRLPYWRAVPMVRFMAGLLDVLVDSSLPGGLAAGTRESHGRRSSRHTIHG
jgi:heat-inducible transcriptional repressor